MQKVKLTLDEMNKHWHVHQSWNGSTLTPTSFKEIRSMYSDSYYLVTVGENKISLPESKGFWLDGGIELFPDKLIPGVSKVYVKEGNTLFLKEVDTVEVVNEYFEFDYLCNTTNHNYTQSNFLLHNFDLEDYVNAGVIGCGNLDLTKGDCCDSWEDMFQTWRATRDAHIKAFNELILASQAYNLKWSDIQAGEYDDWLTVLSDFNDYWGDYYAAAMIFFNSMICPEDKEDGIVTYDLYVNWKFLEFTGTDAWLTDVGVLSDYVSATDPSRDLTYIDINFTNTQTFKEEFYTNFKNAATQLSNAEERVVKKLANIEFLGMDGTQKRGLQNKISLNGNPSLHEKMINNITYTAKLDFPVGSPLVVEHGLATNNIEVSLFDPVTGERISDSLVNINTGAIGSGTFNTAQITAAKGGSYRVSILGLPSNEVEMTSGNSSNTGCNDPVIGPGGE